MDQMCTLTHAKSHVCLHSQHEKEPLLIKGIQHITWGKRANVRHMRAQAFLFFLKMLRICWSRDLRNPYQYTQVVLICQRILFNNNERLYTAKSTAEDKNISKEETFFPRDPPKACRILSGREHAADCYIKVLGSWGLRWFWLSGLSFKVVLRTSGWFCTINVKKSRLWETPGLEPLSIISTHPWLSVASMAYLFHMVIVI